MAKFKAIIIRINSFQRKGLCHSETKWEQIIHVPPPPPSLQRFKKWKVLFKLLQPYLTKERSLSKQSTAKITEEVQGSGVEQNCNFDNLTVKCLTACP